MGGHVWKTSEDAVIRRDYPTQGPRPVSDTLGLGLMQVRNRANRLKIKYTGPRGRSFTPVTGKMARSIQLTQQHQPAGATP